MRTKDMPKRSARTRGTCPARPPMGSLAACGFQRNGTRSVFRRCRAWTVRRACGVVLCAAMSTASCREPSASSTQPADTDPRAPAPIAASRPSASASSQAARDGLPPYVPVPDNVLSVTSFSPREGLQGVSVVIDDVFPASKTRSWYEYRAQENGWRPLPYSLDAPSDDCAGQGWREFGRDPVGLQRSYWWVNDRREALAVDFFYYSPPEVKGIAVMIGYYPPGRRLDALVRRYEAVRGRIWGAGQPSEKVPETLPATRTNDR